MALAKKMMNLRYVAYSMLWMAFLLLQITLFATPAPNDLQNTVQLQEDPAFRDQSASFRRVRNVPYFLRQRHLKQNTTSSGATFNAIDVIYRDNKDNHLQSTTDCVGRDLFKDDLMMIHANYSWMFRSCHYHYLCLNTETHEFVTVGQGRGNGNSDHESAGQEVALGAVNPRWSGRGFNKGFHKIKWAPNQVTLDSIKGYYELPSNVVLVPFHSMAAHNVGHLLWDDLYPLYTLLALFGYTSSNENHKRKKDLQYLVLRWTSDGKLYATCEMQKKKIKICNDNLQRFLPLLGIDPDTFSTVKQAQLKFDSAYHVNRSPYVCSRQAVAGMGMLMDHGTRDHGWMLRDPTSGLDLVPHNLGRGGIFHDFRNYILENMGFSSAIPPPSKRNKITFSTFSSRGFERSLGFENHSAAISQALLENKGMTSYDQKIKDLQVQSITMKDLSLEEQMQVALESAIFVTVSGGGAVTATFLPPGTTLIVYYLEDGGFDFWKYNYTYNPARLDWDLLANAAHLKVHWLPIKSMETNEDLNILKHLVLHDLETMKLL